MILVSKLTGKTIAPGQPQNVRPELPIFRNFKTLTIGAIHEPTDDHPTGLIKIFADAQDNSKGWMQYNPDVIYGVFVPKDHLCPVCRMALLPKYFNDPNSLNSVCTQCEAGTPHEERT